MAGPVLSHIGNSKLGSSENKSTDPFWTLDDFKKSAHMAAERAPSLKSDQEPAMMAPLDVMLLLRSHVPTTLELSLVTDSDATGSDERTVDLHDRA